MSLYFLSSFSYYNQNVKCCIDTNIINNLFLRLDTTILCRTHLIFYALMFILHKCLWTYISPLQTLYTFSMHFSQNVLCLWQGRLSRRNHNNVRRSEWCSLLFFSFQIMLWVWFEIEISELFSLLYKLQID